jgi:NTE family protein
VRVVAVFGGGGAKSFACVGAWQAMAEAGIRPVQVVGTSMGAVIGAALASGQTPEQVLGAAGALSRKDVAPINLFALFKGVFAASLLKPDGLRRAIARLVPATRFAELGVPLTVTATDIDSGDLVLYGAGGQGGVSLHDVLYASCALPLYFPLAEVGGRRLVDGGLRAVLGLEAARTIPADLVLAVHVGPGFDEPLAPAAARSRLAPPLIRAHGEALRVMMADQVERSVRAWPREAPRLVVVRPVAEREATFAVQEIARYVAAGYRETQAALG